jgi:hypothetical protein
LTPCAHLHVIQMHRASSHAPWQPECGTLSSEDLHGVAVAARKANGIKNLAREIEGVRAARGLPGLLVLRVGAEDAPVLPAPLPYPFEPLPIGGGQCDDACKLLVLGQQALDQMQEAQLAAQERAHRRRQRLILAASVACGGCQVIRMLLRGLWNLRELLTGCIAIGGVLLLVLALVYLRRAWYLVPQGAFLLRARTPWSAPSELFSAADCTLLIDFDPGEKGWHAYFVRRRCVLRCSLSSVECIALLAAWRSPVPPPSVEDVTNLA